MISRETALRYLKHYVSILVDGRFFKGKLILVTEKDLTLLFKEEEQSYSLEKIERIQGGNDGH